MPRWGQMSRSANTRPSRPRPISTGSPNSVLCTIRPGRMSAPRSATYHNPRTSSALRSCIHCPRGDEPGLLHRHERQVGVARLAASLRQHAMHLAAMMGLVIEHVGDRKPLRLGHLRLHRPGVPRELPCERGTVDPLGPREHSRIEGCAFMLQIVPVIVDRYRFGDATVRLGSAGEPMHPDAIRPQQMVERGMDRAEERAAVTPPFGVGKRIGDTIKVLVLPAVIARHALHIAGVDHRHIRSTGGAARAQERRRISACASAGVCPPSSEYHAAIATLAFSTMAAKAAGSWIARSDSTLRSTRRPALASPSMNRL